MTRRELAAKPRTGGGRITGREPGRGHVVSMCLERSVSHRVPQGQHVRRGGHEGEAEQ